MPGAFSPRALEREYLEARYAQYRSFSLRLGIVTVFLPLGLWLRDYLNDAAGGRATLGFRLLMSAGVLAYVLTLALRAPRRLALLAAFLGVLLIDVVASMGWGLVPIHAIVGFADYMYLILLAPPLLMPLSLRQVAAVLVTVGLVPNLQAAFGVELHYSLPLFNLVMWPACAIAAFWLYEFDQVSRRLFTVQRQMREQAMNDVLTGLGNRRHFEESASALLAGARRRARNFALLMLDIDHFKAINDRHGHAAGDDVLRELARVLRRALRASDLCGRIGGEEFAVLLPDEDLEGGRIAGERLRRAVEALLVESASAKGPISFTVSVGVSAYPRDGEDLAPLLQRADERLYLAKEAGRNRVVASG